MGCSCAPSPAFTIADRQWRARKCGAPDDAWRSTIMSGFMASRLRAVSSSVSPFCDARGGGRDGQAVRGEDLLRDLERRAGAGGGLVEEVDHRLAAQRRDLLDRPVEHLAQRLRGVEDRLDVRRLQGLDARAGGDGVDAHRRPLLERRASSPAARPPAASRRGRPSRAARTRSSPSSSASITCTISSRVVVSVLPDVVGADRQLAVAAIDQHRQLDARRAPEVDQLVEGRARRCARCRGRRPPAPPRGRRWRRGCRCPSGRGARRSWSGRRGRA